jgi:glycerate kinase
MKLINALYFRSMKIVIAPDKFKNALTAKAFCDSVATKLAVLLPEADVLKLPLADGGDGTIGVIKHYLNAAFMALEVCGPVFNPVKANYLYAVETQTAFIELAEASGLKLLDPMALNCKNTTTYGTGELIKEAMDKGATRIILGLGGSATNDCGIGMASALGYRFLDENGATVRPIGANLNKIKHIDTSRVNPKLQSVTFQVACDVSNPLYGPNGAAYVYAPQKGATAEDVRCLDEGLEAFSKVIYNTFGIDAQTVNGAGAAGGMGIAAMVFLGGTLVSGIAIIKALAKFDAQLKGVDWIITGEGTLDAQTTSGKTIYGVTVSAKAQGVKVAALCGQIENVSKAIQTLGLDYTDEVMRYAKTIADAMRHSKTYLEQMTVAFVDHIKEN